MSAFSLEKSDDGIALLKIDVINESMNTLKAEFIDDVSAVLDQIEQDTSIKGVVLYSGKPDSFIAGADIHMIDACHSIDEATQISLAGQVLFQRIEDLKVPMVAAIHGVCLGGGLELALACSVRVCSDSDTTQLGLPEVQLGVLPGGGGTQRLPRLIGITQALDLMLTGKKVRAKKALKIGLVDDAVAQPLLMQTAKSWVKKASRFQRKLKQPLAFKIIESFPTGRRMICNKALKQVQAKTQGNYPAPEKIIHCALQGQKLFQKADYPTEARAFGELVQTPESAALRSIFFSTTQMKKETGAGTSQPLKIRKVAVIGGGFMGGGIAGITIAKAQIPTRIKDLKPQGLSMVLAHSHRLLKSKWKRGYMSRLQFNRTLALLSTSTSYAGLQETDIVVEAVYEDLKLKHQIVQELEQAVHAETIIASNTSSLPIADIAQAASRPQNVIGLHYFSPVDKMPLVEVIPHDQTSQTAIATAVDLARKQGKTPIVVKDCAGFYVNRILALYMSEAARLLFEQVCPLELDQAVVRFGFPLGPFTLLDEVGIDISAKIVPILTEKLGDRFHVPDIFESLIADQRLGKKVKKGFYLYKSKKQDRKVIDPAVYSVLKLSGKTIPLPAEAVERCVLQMLNEAARCLQEGIIAHPRDGDIGAIFGIGFPPFLGGPFHYMDRLGVAQVVERMKLFSTQYGERFFPCDILLKMREQNTSFYTSKAN